MTDWTPIEARAQALPLRYEGGTKTGRFTSDTPNFKEIPKMMTMNDIQIGDIFSSSWGYEQTNVDFYEVVRKTAKMIELRAIGKRIEGDQGPMSGTAYADPSVKGPSIGLRRPRFTAAGCYGCYVTIDNVSGASRMPDPKAGKYCSWYA